MKNQITIKTSKGSYFMSAQFCGKRIAVHKPVRASEDQGLIFENESCSWSLTHIKTGYSMGRCYWNKDKVIAFAKKWDDCEELDAIDLENPDTWAIAKKFNEERNALCDF
jgi:hypothetical protein